MKKPNRSAFLFICDILILYGSFFWVYAHYNGYTAIPLKAGALMVFIAF